MSNDSQDIVLQQPKDIDEALAIIFHGADDRAQGKDPNPIAVVPKDPLNPNADDASNQRFYEGLNRALAAHFVAEKLDGTPLADTFHNLAQHVADVSRNYFHAGNIPHQMPDVDLYQDASGLTCERSNLGTHLMNAIGANHHFVDVDHDGAQSMWASDETADSYRCAGPVTSQMQAHPDFSAYLATLQSGEPASFDVNSVALGLNPSYDPHTREVIPHIGSADMSKPGGDLTQLMAHVALDVAPAFPNAGPFISYEGRHEDDVGAAAKGPRDWMSIAAHSAVTEGEEAGTCDHHLAVVSSRGTLGASTFDTAHEQTSYIPAAGEPTGRLAWERFGDVNQATDVAASFRAGLAADGTHDGGSPNAFEYDGSAPMNLANSNYISDAGLATDVGGNYGHSSDAGNGDSAGSSGEGS
jgi:hypothetical protein